VLNNIINQSGLVIAVFPFENLTASNDFQIFCKAFWIDLITELSRFKHLQIIDYQSIKHIQPQNIKNVNELLSIKTDYIIQGSFIKENDSIKINAKLLNSQSLQIVWSESLVGKAKEIFDLQENLLQKTVSTLQQQVNYDLLSQIRKKPRTSLKAYECWLFGVEELRKGTLDSEQNAREYFNQAISIDPNYSLAIQVCR